MHEPAPGAGPAPSWLLAADGGPKTRGRPIHGRLESDDGDSEARAEPDESAGDLARIHGVTPRTRPRSANASPRPKRSPTPSATPASSAPRAARRSPIPTATVR